MVKVTEYEKIHDIAFAEVGELQNVIEQKADYNNADGMILEKVNFDRIIFNLERTKSNVMKSRVRYRYNKLSNEEFELQLRNIAQGENATIVEIGLEHRVRSVDTLRLLALMYDVEEEKILSHNKISPSKFDDIRELNGVIKIPKLINLDRKNDYSLLPVFGSVEGAKAWGSDWPNELNISDEGDVIVLDNKETLIQGLKNSFGEFGDIPGYEEATIDLDWGKDYDSEMIDVMTIAKLSQRLLSDARIKEVKDIQIQTEGNAKIVILDFKPINGEESLTTKLKSQEREIKILSDVAQG